MLMKGSTENARVARKYDGLGYRYMPVLVVTKEVRTCPVDGPCPQYYSKYS